MSDDAPRELMPFDDGVLLRSVVSRGVQVEKLYPYNFGK
jgi:hypothetical protein